MRCIANNVLENYIRNLRGKKNCFGELGLVERKILKHVLEK
jgi:hypothetical protein